MLNKKLNKLFVDMKGIDKFVKSHKLVILLLGVFIFGVRWSIYVNDDVTLFEGFIF